MTARIIPFLVSCGVAALLSLASPAEAGIVFANAAAPLGGGANNSKVLTGSFDTTTVSGTTGSLNAVDGTMGLQLDPSTGTNTFFFRFGWNPGASATANGDINLRLFLGTVGSGITVTVVDVVYQNNGAANEARFLGVNQVIGAGSGGVQTINLGGLTPTFTGAFATDFSAFTNTYITLSFTGGVAGTNATDTFQIDAISTTPEPGTWALFGLGTLGLAGLVRRRRRKKLNITAEGDATA